MTKILVTRGGQITLTKEIRKKFGIKEGDLVNINSIGEIIIISKKNPETFNIHGFLPESFPKTLENLRKLDSVARLKKLKIIE